MVRRRRRRISVIIWVVVVLGIVTGGCVWRACSGPRASSPIARPETWAQPIELAGAENLHRVSKDLYRSEQPTEEGFKGLKDLGIRTVLNLRAFHSDKDEIEDAELGTAFRVERIYFNTWHAEDEDVVRFLRIVTDKGNTPVLLHCRHGADRTGLMCAIYRVAVQGWTKDEALREMTEGGFGYHSIWANLPKYFRELDVERIRAEAGLDQ